MCIFTLIFYVVFYPINKLVCLLLLNKIFVPVIFWLNAVFLYFLYCMSVWMQWPLLFFFRPHIECITLRSLRRNCVCCSVYLHVGSLMKLSALRAGGSSVDPDLGRARQNCQQHEKPGQVSSCPILTLVVSPEKKDSRSCPFRPSKLKNLFILFYSCVSDAVTSIVYLEGTIAWGLDGWIPFPCSSPLPVWVFPPLHSFGEASVPSVFLLDLALHYCPSPFSFLHATPTPPPPWEEWYCWCITTQDNLFKWQIRRVTWFVTDTECSVCYQSNIASPLRPLCVFRSTPSLLCNPPHRSQYLLHWAPIPTVERWREKLVSSVCDVIAGWGPLPPPPTPPHCLPPHIIELWGWEVVSFGEALIESLIGAVGLQEYASQLWPINQTIKPSCFHCSIYVWALSSKCCTIQMNCGSPPSLFCSGLLCTCEKGICESAFCIVAVSVKPLCQRWQSRIPVLRSLCTGDPRRHSPVFVVKSKHVLSDFNGTHNCYVRSCVTILEADTHVGKREDAHSKIEGGRCHFCGLSFGLPL